VIVKKTSATKMARFTYTISGKWLERAEASNLAELESEAA
jgi:hypothetical protein